jgi:L-aspartate oxidase
MYKRYLQNFSLGEQSKCYDVVVVGAGVAGLFASLTLDPKLKVLVIAKEGLRDCNSQLAQGGIAITLDEDYESHIEDTLKAGSYYNDANVVAKMIGMSQLVFDKLVAIETDFDLNEDGSISMTAEGGHRKRRIIHSKDVTGEAVMTALLNELPKRANIEVRTQTKAIDVVTKNDKVIGLVLQEEGLQSEAVACERVILATGGIGGLFKSTTNVAVNTGDGFAMALRAGAMLRDREFIQYHPTAMALKEGGYFLISEAVRGEGGHLINDLGERFMDGQHEMKELAPRDIVAKAINDQRLLGRAVFVDVRHFEQDAFKNRFPNIYATCLKNGIDPSTQPIPITPVEHYYMGGIACTADGKTCNEKGQTLVDGLYASGESACTGFHGANRLASNSLLECLTLSLRISDDINRVVLDRCNDALLLESKDCSKGVNSDFELSYTSALPEVPQTRVIEITKLFKEQFSKTFTIVKKVEVLEEAKMLFDAWLLELESYSCQLEEAMALYNALMIAREIAMGSLERKVSLGAFILEGRK